MSGGPGQSTSGRAQDARVRCIVWTPREQRMSGQLATVLAARTELHVIEVNSCFAALAALLMQVTGKEAKSSQVLVLHGPQRLQGAADVISRLERYLPSCKVWAYVESPKPQLRGLQPSDLAATSPSASIKPAQVLTPPRVVVVPGIASKVKRVGESGGQIGGQTGGANQAGQTGWTPRVVGAGDFAPTTRQDTHDQRSERGTSATSDNSLTQGSSATSAVGAGGLAGGVRPPSLLTDEELSMLLANDTEREHN